MEMPNMRALPAGLQLLACCTLGCASHWGMAYMEQPWMKRQENAAQRDCRAPQDDWVLTFGFPCPCVILALGAFCNPVSGWAFTAVTVWLHSSDFTLQSPSVGPQWNRGRSLFRIPTKMPENNASFLPNRSLSFLSRLLQGSECKAFDYNLLFRSALKKESQSGLLGV